mmetsp:Transcript_13839/g.16056  ORF Transcript_13839/g.16056 Transcript_13839/m.16056 type:complete len:85 (+) Transcript_13839:275-529(+)
MANVSTEKVKESANMTEDSQVLTGTSASYPSPSTGKTRKISIFHDGNWKDEENIGVSSEETCGIKSWGYKAWSHRINKDGWFFW